MSSRHELFVGVDQQNMGVGIEMEGYLVNPQGKLSFRAQEVLGMKNGHALTNEFLQCMIEVNPGPAQTRTGLIGNVLPAVQWLTELREQGVFFAPVGCQTDEMVAREHVFPVEYYHWLWDNVGGIRNAHTCSVHVSLGIPQDETYLVYAHNVLAELGPLFRACAANSFCPQEQMFCLRGKVWGALDPTVQLTVLESYEDYLERIESAQETVGGRRRFWPYLKIHPNRLEIRIFDAPPTLDEVVMWAGVLFLLNKRLYEFYLRGERLQVTFLEDELNEADAQVLQNGFGAQVPNPFTGTMSTTSTAGSMLLNFLGAGAVAEWPEVVLLREIFSGNFQNGSTQRIKLGIQDECIWRLHAARRFKKSVDKYAREFGEV